MNDWAVTAASGLPLEATIRSMHEANQPYSQASGIIFAALGGALAICWGILVLLPRLKISVWAALLLWSGIIMLGAPAYFFASFSNMNSVGDTFFAWNASAAFSLEAPLYLASGVAVLIAVGTTVKIVVDRTSRKTHTATI